MDLHSVWRHQPEAGLDQHDPDQRPVCELPCGACRRAGRPAGPVECAAGKNVSVSSERALPAATLTNSEPPAYRLPLTAYVSTP